MAKFGGMTLTKEGRNLLAKALTGKDLKFVRVATGDGRLPDGQSIYDMTAMVHPVQDLPIASCTVTGVGTATIQAVMTNQGLDMGFFVREMGLFATDPDSGGETLYGYCNAGDEADYMPGQNGPDAVQYLFSLVTVIDQAQNVTAVISSGLVFVTHPELSARVDDLFAASAPIFEFWTRTQGDDKKLRPASLAEVKLSILGTHDIENLDGRIRVLEDVVAQTLLELEVSSIYPNYTHFIIEDFRKPDQVDMFSCKVVHVVAGSSAIDCERIQGLVPGCTYTLTDGSSRELVQVRSVNVENGLNRIVTSEPVKNTYRGGKTLLYRTSAIITPDGAEGVSSPMTAAWRPMETWKGVSGNTVFDVVAPTNLASAGSFEIEGDISWSGSTVTLEVSA